MALPLVLLLAACAGPGPVRSQFPRAHPERVIGLAMGDGGRLVASLGAEGLIRLWRRVDSAQALAPGPILTAGEGDPFAAVALSPDGSLVAAARRTIHLWSAAGKPLPGRFPERLAWLRCLAFSPDGRSLAAGADSGEVLVFETGGGPVLRHPAHRLPVLALAFSPDGRLLASGGADERVALRRLDGGSPPWPERLTAGPVTALAFSRDGGRLAAGHGRHVTEWAVGDGRVDARRWADSRVYAVAYPAWPDTIHVACGDGVLWFGRGQLQGGFRRDIESGAQALALSADSRMLVAGLADGSIVVWRW